MFPVTEICDPDEWTTSHLCVRPKSKISPHPFLREKVQAILTSQASHLFVKPDTVTSYLFFLLPFSSSPLLSPFVSFSLDDSMKPLSALDRVILEALYFFSKAICGESYQAALTSRLVFLLRRRIPSDLSHVGIQVEFPLIVPTAGSYFDQFAAVLHVMQAIRSWKNKKKAEWLSRSSHFVDACGQTLNWIQNASD